MSDIGALAWLQDWYASQCDGDWEHGYGIKIGTLDNPGWAVEINLLGTPFAERTAGPLTVDVGEDDWLHASIADGKFKGYGDPHRLEQIVLTFRDWIEA
jgi:hypothetical protein